MKLITIFICDDLLGNDVDNQCVCRGHIEAPWFSNDLDASVSRKILIKGWVNYCCDLERKSESVHR